MRVDFEQMLERAKAAGIKPPLRTLVVLDGDEAPIELLHKDAALAFQKALHLVADDEEAHSHDAAPRDLMAGWSPAERLTRDEGAWRAVRLAALRTLLDRPRTLADLRLIAHRLVDCSGEFGLIHEALGLDCDDEEAALHAWVDRATPDQLGAVLVADALNDALCVVAWRDQADAVRMVLLAEHYGVDVDAHARAAQAASTPSPAARAPEGAAADAPAAPALKPVQAWPFPKKTKGQKVDAGGAAAVEHAEAAA